MQAQFSIWPLQSQVVDVETARMINETLAGLDVDFDVNSMGTLIRGDWGQVMAAILACHEAVANRHARVLTNIVIDDQRGTTLSADEAVCQAQLVEDVQPGNTTTTAIAPQH